MIEKVGVIVVHGIGEQRRFQFADAEVRSLIQAVRGLQAVKRISVNINPSVGGAFMADHDTWAGGSEPSVTIVVHHVRKERDIETRLDIHEVWYADVNEPYSLAKQFRFWLWGLAVWAHPFRGESNLPTSDEVFPPIIPGFSNMATRNWARVRLFATGVVFTQVGLSLGFLAFLASRLFNIQVPDILKTLANYISGVKLYNQTVRFGPGLPWSRQDYLDSVGMPPRVSVRRRMIRTIADVASNEDYQRWYVLAHSLGSIVAFNGLMETGYAWPAYLDEARWKRLKGRKLAGQPNAAWRGRHANRSNSGPTFPERPAWLDNGDVAYRGRIFEKFRGFLTYGSPLEKFAAIWPSLVPISRVKAFRHDVVWINVLNPTDPVAGQLTAFEGQNVMCCPHPVNVAYSTSHILLLSHLKYLTYGGTDGLAAKALEWLITDNPESLKHPTSNSRKFFEIGSGRFKAQTALAFATWAAALAGTAWCAGFVLPVTVDAARTISAAIGRGVSRLGSGAPSSGTVSQMQTSASCDGWWCSFRQLGSSERGLIILGAGIFATGLVGAIGNRWFRARLTEGRGAKSASIGFEKKFLNRKFDVVEGPDPST